MATKFSYLYVIPNTTAPYGYEFVNILCLPHGIKGRFRFSDKWVSEEFKANFKEYCGKRINILLRDKETAVFSPLRKAIVDDISKIGDTYYIQYTLKGFFEYDSKESVRKEQLEFYRKEFSNYHTDLRNNRPDTDMDPLVFGSNFEHDFVNKHFDALETTMKDLEVFQNIIDTIKGLSFFTAVTFTKIIQLRQANNSNIVPIVDGRYILKEETDYEFSIFQTAPTLSLKEVLTPNDIEIFSDAKYVSIIKGKQRAVGKYDIFNMLFRTNINTAGVNSFIDIRYRLKPGADQYIEPNLSIPVSIKLRYRSIFWRVCILVASISLYFYSYLVKSLMGIPLDVLKDVTLVTVAVVVFDLKTKLIDFFKRR